MLIFAFISEMEPHRAKRNSARKGGAKEAVLERQCRLEQAVLEKQ